jgi:predicted sulfurtransferase
MQNKKSIFLAAVAVIITVTTVWYAHRPITPNHATWDDVLTEAEAGGYQIITTEALADRFREDRSGMLLVDTRQEWEYRAGHIAGALLFPMEPTWWARWRKAEALREILGPDKDRMVVFY